MDNAIIVEKVTKKYRLYTNSKERVLDLISPKKYGEEFYALQDVSFKAEKGDIIGFIGINGSGKSTLSNIIAGIVPETSGSVKVNGETSLIAVAAGLKDDLTGRDNIELKCLMLGFSKSEIKKLEPAIIEFAELEQFINQPVKSYSSGMKSRLGFAISVNVDPEILIIDEALSVGDRAFAEKSLQRMKEFKDLGKTMIFVSHSIGQMKSFCEKILWLEFGRVKEFGTVEEVIPKYEKFLEKWQRMSKAERDAYKNYALLQDETSLENLIDIERNQSTLYKEESISRIGHIKSGASDIYITPKTMDGIVSSEGYKHCAYYIKKEALYKDELYFLLSTHPSAIHGTIGWMNATDVATHEHVLIDRDLKSYRLKGTGAAYNRPWGGKRNLVIAELNPYKCVDFKVDSTEKVGSNLWYYGTVNGQYVWIHANHVKADEFNRVQYG